MMYLLEVLKERVLTAQESYILKNYILQIKEK